MYDTEFHGFFIDFTYLFLRVHQNIQQDDAIEDNTAARKALQYVK